MACIHNGFEGTCTFFDENAEDIDINLGVSAEGYCICEDDECPTDSCTYFESDEDEDEEQIAANEYLETLSKK